MADLRNSGVNALKWLGGYLKTDMVYLASGGFWLSIGQFVASMSAFLTSIAFANLLSPDAYGIYKYIISINSLLLITTLSGMDSAVIQSVSRGFDGTLNAGVRTKMKWGTIGTICSFGIALYYFLNGNMILSISFSLVAFFVPFAESFDMYNSLLFGKKLFNVQTKYSVIKKIITLVAMISVLFLTQNLYYIILTYFLSVTLPNLYFLRRTEKIYKENDNVDKDSIKYGKNLSAINIITLVLGELDKVLVFQYVGAANLAIYSLATAPTDQIKGLLKNINALALPQFAQRTSEDIKKTIWQKIKILSIVSVIIIAAYVILAPFFFKVFFPKYLDSILFSQILAVSLLPVIISGFIYTVFESQKAQKQIYQFNVYSSIFGLIILFPMVYFYGLWGAIISRIVTRIFIFSLSVKLINDVE